MAACFHVWNIIENVNPWFQEVSINTILRHHIFFLIKKHIFHTYLHNTKKEIKGVPMKLKHIQGSNIHSLPRNIDILTHKTTCHLDRRWHPLCETAQLTHLVIKLYSLLKISIQNWTKSKCRFQLTFTELKAIRLKVQFVHDELQKSHQFIQ